MAIHTNDSITSRDETQAHIAIAFLVLTWIFILLRIWTRTCLISNFGWDDLTMLLAGLLYTVYCTTMIRSQVDSRGTRVTSVDDLNRLIKWTITGEASYIMTVMMLKISLGIFFARVVIAPWQLMIIYITVGVNIFSSAGSFFYVIFRCGADLDVYVYKQLYNNCTPRALDRFFAFQQASFTTATDLVFIVLPVFILWDVSLSIRSKLTVGFILSLGALGCICSLIRFQYIDGLTQIEDFYWNAANIAIWSTIEPGAGIIAGCLATLRPIVSLFIATARTLGSSAPKSGEKSKDNSSNTGGAAGSNALQQGPSRSRRRTDADTYPQDDRSIELKSDVSTKNESKDCILTQTEDIDILWPSQQAEDQDLKHSVDLDRRSSHETIQTTRTTWTTRSRQASIAQYIERPLPPLPPALPKRDSRDEEEV